MLEQINTLALNNSDFTEEIRYLLNEKYKTFMEEYGEFYTRWDYLGTMYSTRFVKVKKLEQQIKSNNLITSGSYQTYSHTIKFYNEESDFFHEKLHADDLWFSYNDWYKYLFKEDFENNMYTYSLQDELLASFGSQDGYYNLRVVIRLLGELMNRKTLAKNIITKNLEKIWEELQEGFTNRKEEIERLEELLLLIYKEGYILGETTSQEKQEFWNIYELLYEEKYQKSPEEDLIASYLKDTFFGYIKTNEKNKIEYDSTYNIFTFLNSV